MNAKRHDVLIVGGGISGTALLYLLSRYTDLPNIGLVEKCTELADINSHARNNSQTLHCGDIETNYTLEKAKTVQQGANMLVNYAQALPDHNDILRIYPKMVIGVGDQEVAFLQQRYTEFNSTYPGMRLLERDQIAEIEPKVMEGRSNSITALAVLNEPTAVNYQLLAESFCEQARSATSKKANLYLGTKVTRIDPRDDGFDVHTPGGTLFARCVVVSAGAHSLLFAQRMGYGKQYACLPVAGSFYYVPRLLNGKVYTVQNPVLPFAAIHGDPDLLIEDKTRLGPTALVLPMLERYNYHTIPEFFRTFMPDAGVMKVMWDLLKVKDIRNYIFKNFLFEVPGLRQSLFLKDAKKIIPTLKLEDLTYANRIGGIRPVMIDRINRKLHLGEAKINPGTGIIFNMTPSPGATSCLQNAEQDLKTIVDHLGCHFDVQQLENDLKKESPR